MKKRVHLLYLFALVISGLLFYILFAVGFSVTAAGLGSAALGWLFFYLGLKFKIKEDERFGESRFMALIEASAQVVWSTTVAGLVTEDSPSWRKFTGQTFEEWRGTGWINAIHPDDRADAVKLWAEANQKKSRYETSYRLKHVDGGWRWTTARGIPLLNPSGDLVGWVGMNDDISKQKAIEENLLENELHFRTLAETVPDFIWIADEHAKVYYWNPAWYKYTGLSEEQSFGEQALTAIREDFREPVLAAWQETLKNKTRLELEFPLKNTAGEYRWFISRATPVKASDGRIIKWTGSMVDINDQKILNEELMEERELREKFVATLTHDLRNVLSTGRLAAHFLKRQPDATADEKKLATVVNCFSRTEQMIQDLLAANHLHAGQPFPLKELSTFCLKELLAETVEDLLQTFGDGLHLHCPEPIEVHWSRDDIKRVIENLSNNAKKYGKENGTIVVGARRHLENVELWVHNWGNPIPCEDQKILFEFLQRSTSARSSGKQGWGIGLTLVKGIVDSHSGSIEVKSSEEDGTNFLLRLPRDAKQAELASNFSREKP
jgi:PAS domain S-box-containing protein